MSVVVLGDYEKVGIGANHVDHVDHFNQRVLPFACPEKVVDRLRDCFKWSPIHNS